MSISLVILIITGLVSYKGFNDRSLIYKFIFNPYQIEHRKEWWRWFTHGFIHADWAHLAFNMIALYSFGEYLEYLFQEFFGNKGKWYFLLLYSGGLVVSSSKSFVQHKNNPGYNSLGASGAVSAVIFSFILIQPKAELMVFFIPGIPGWIFGILYLGYSHYMSKKQMDNIGHDAHFYGAVYGFLLTLLLKPSLGKAFIEQILN